MTGEVADASLQIPQLDVVIWSLERHIRSVIRIIIRDTVALLCAI